MDSGSIPGNVFDPTAHSGTHSLFRVVLLMVILGTGINTDATRSSTSAFPLYLYPILSFFFFFQDNKCQVYLIKERLRISFPAGGNTSLVSTPCLTYGSFTRRPFFITSVIFQRISQVALPEREVSRLKRTFDLTVKARRTFTQVHTTLYLLPSVRAHLHRRSQSCRSARSRPGPAPCPGRTRPWSTAGDPLC